MQPINIVLAPDNNYARHCGVVMASAIANAKENSRLNFYILDGGLSEENKAALRRIEAGKPYNVEFPRINEGDFDGFPSMKYITVSTWYRFKISTLIPDTVDRILYLDCDTIVNQPLDELFEMPMGSFLLAGAVDNLWRRYSKVLGMPPDYHYFNAGVLVMNLKAWREERMEEKLFKFLADSPENIKLMDQSVLNLFMGARTKGLHVKWNFQYGTPFLEDTCYHMADCRRQYLEAFFNPAIIHYMGEYKPWKDGISCLHRFRGEYYKYLKFTPWKFASDEDEEAFQKNASGSRPLEFMKKLASNLRHKPLLVFRKYYLGRIYLAAQTGLKKRGGNSKRS